MDSYKKWKSLNENFGPGAFTLGLSQPQNMGLNMGQYSAITDMIEGKKKKKDIVVDVEDDSDDLGDEDGVIADEGCGCGSKSKKKSKKKSSKNASKKSSKKSAKKMDGEMGGDFEDDDGDDHDHDDHDDDDHDDDDGDDHDDDADDHDDDGDEDGEGEEPTDAAGGAGPMFSKKKSGKKSAKKSSKKSGKKSKKKMQKESTSAYPNQWWRSDDAEWMKSVQSMLGPKSVTKNRDGWSEYQEDSLFPASDPNAAVTAPAPGQPGFAPSGRLDVGFNGTVSLGEAVKIVSEACDKAGPKLQKKLLRKLTELHRKLS